MEIIEHGGGPDAAGKKLMKAMEDFNANEFRPLW